MDTGVWVLAGIFAFAAILIVAGVRRRSAVRKRLLAQGFEACDDQAPALLQAWSEVAGGLGPAERRKFQVRSCFRKPAGWGMVHRFAVSDVTNADSRNNAMGGRYDAYLIDLRDPESVFHAPASIFLSGSGSKLFRRVLEKLVSLGALGVRLEIPKRPGCERFFAAFGASPGKLDDALPAATQERLARAADLGFFAAHLGAGKLGLAALPDQKDVDRLWNYVSEWT